MTARLQCDNCSKIIGSKTSIQVRLSGYPNPGPFDFCCLSCLREWVLFMIEEAS